MASPRDVERIEDGLDAIEAVEAAQDAPVDPDLVGAVVAGAIVAKNPALAPLGVRMGRAIARLFGWFGGLF